jgi:hypothetical protein
VLHSPGLLVDHGSQLSLALDAGAGRSPLALLLEGVSCTGNAIFLLQQMTEIASSCRIGVSCCRLPYSIMPRAWRGHADHDN